jgi:hypothetical protein
MDLYHSSDDPINFEKIPLFCCFSEIFIVVGFFSCVPFSAVHCVFFIFIWRIVICKIKRRRGEEQLMSDQQLHGFDGTFWQGMR